MNTLWRGSISFGLVNIPVRVCGAVDESQVHFNQVHEPCNTRIRYQKYCPCCDKQVENYEIIKGYKTPGGMITIKDEELDSIAAALPSLKTLELAGFIKEKEVDSLLYPSETILSAD